MSAFYGKTGLSSGANHQESVNLMSKSLVIVESPAKAKTINKYLGQDFVVKSSVGHIRDLPTSGSGSTTDPATRAKEAAKTRKMDPEEKAAHKARKAKQLSLIHI